MVSYTFLCLCFFEFVVTVDYYSGVFNRNDFLVAQDHLYKERIPYRVSQAMYGRYFKCPITYFRVMDRLGMGRGPRVLLTRGGLGHRFLTLRITSQYNLPTSVTVLVGCENKKTTTPSPGGPGGVTSAPPGGGTSAPPGGGALSPPGPGGSGTPGPGGDTSSSSPGAASSIAPDASNNSTGASKK